MAFLATFMMVAVQRPLVLLVLTLGPCPTTPSSCCACTLFLIGTAFKGLWAAHTHVNWNYDLYFHNHRRAWVRKTMWALAHVLVFPTQHHHHHARGPNSARNVTSTLAIYDWLVFGTLAIETSKPKVYGWRQKDPEANSVLKRYFCWDVREMNFRRN